LEPASVYRLAALAYALLIGLTASVSTNPPASASNATAFGPSVALGSRVTASYDDTAGAVAALELHLFDLTNAERVRAGLPPLNLDDQLMDVARTRASDQVHEDALNHYDANGDIAFAPMLTERGMSFDLVGENLARVPGPSGDAASRADALLIQSPGHRANILDPRFNFVAIGSTLDASGNVIFAEIFRTAS